MRVDVRDMHDRDVTICYLDHVPQVGDIVKRFWHNPPGKEMGQYVQTFVVASVEHWAEGAKQTIPESIPGGIYVYAYETDMQAPSKDQRLLFLQFIAGLTFCENIGDLSDDINFVLDKLSVEKGNGANWETSNRSLRRALHKIGITTMYGSALVDDDEQ